MEQKIEYGNWVPRKMIFFLALICIACIAATLTAPVFILKMIFFILGVLFLLLLIYFMMVRQSLSYDGGQVSAKMLNYVIGLSGWDGKGRALDIGAGSGIMCIKLAEKYPEAIIDGIDLWGPGWDYSKEIAEKNAAVAGVADRITYTKASASKLPFHDETFDLVISNMTFHEVKDCNNKPELLREALRTLKKGGHFVFHDLFGKKTAYNPEAIERVLNELNLKEVTIRDTSKLEFIPKLMRTPLVFGNIKAIYGIK